MAGGFSPCAHMVHAIQRVQRREEAKNRAEACRLELPPCNEIHRSRCGGRSVGCNADEAEDDFNKRFVKKEI